VVGVAVLAVILALSLVVGRHPIDPATVATALVSPDDTYASRVVWEVRVPRTLLGLIVAMALAVSGGLMQSLTRNPLADPGILGVNAGAGFGVVIAVVVFGLTAFSDHVWFAVVGALVATLVVFALGSRGPGAGTPLRMTLIGVALGAVLGGIGATLELFDPDTFDVARFWSMGTINIQDLPLVLTMVPFIAFGLMIAALMAHQLNALALGDDLAQSLGARLGAVRLGVIVAVILLCGTATAAAGLIAFVGFIVPHVASWFVGPDQRWILAYGLVIAPIMLLGADLLGRLLLPAGSLPVGLMTTVIGAPVVIVLVRRARIAGL
jgi:iron complex transport system permease protein